MSITTLLSNVQEFFTKVFSVDTTNPGMATQLVTFVAATPICQIPIILYIMVALGATARRFIPGV